jgi:hypothetical protein
MLYNCTLIYPARDIAVVRPHLARFLHAMQQGTAADAVVLPHDDGLPVEAAEVVEGESCEVVVEVLVLVEHASGL